MFNKEGVYGASGELLLFAEIVEAGSLTAVAQARDLSRSLLSKRLKNLERHLGVRLLNRTTRRISLTEPGERLYRHCRRLREVLEDADSEIAGLGNTPRGELRLTVPVPLGQHPVAALLAEFLTRYPDVQVNLSLDERFIDLVEEGYDVAIRIGQLDDSSLIARRLGSTRIHCAAAPAYLDRYGIPGHPDELIRHNCLTYRHARERSDVWVFSDQGRPLAVRVKSSLRGDNGLALCQAAVAGLGVVRMPSFIIGGHLTRGRLVPILADYLDAHLPIYVVYPSGSHLPAKTRVFIDFLIDAFDRYRDWD